MYVTEFYCLLILLYLLGNAEVERDESYVCKCYQQKQFTD